MLTINSVGLSHGPRTLFKDVDLILLPNKRYGVVGANGSGKSSLLRVLAGEEAPSAGSIEKANNVTVGILKQDHFRYEQDRVIDVVIKGNAELWSAFKEKETLLEKPELSETEGYRLGTLEEIILHNDGYDAQARAENLLIGLGILAKYHYGPLNALSGGYKLRTLLAQVLFQNPDIMLLDEPTNHLDIITIAWLEQFLKTQFKGLLIFVSHDREFLNNLSTIILDIDYGTITSYVGNYDQFEGAKEQTLLQKQNEYDFKEKQIATMQSFVDRFKASANRSRQAMSRQKMIDRIELPEIKNSSMIKPYFHFVPEKPSGKSVLKIEHIAKKFDEHPLLTDISFSLSRVDKCAIIGPNGIGKSTLLKILLGQLSADHGHYQWGETVKIGYFAQDYKEQLPREKTVWEWLEAKAAVPAQRIRNVLGQVLFRGQDVEKKIGMLSGGESARLVLAQLILEQNNALILDEPTNHLDLESIDALTEALHKFPGAILMVSHNRYFIDRVATRILALSEKKGARNYLGNYHEYLAQYGEDYLARA
jgi:ATPase subunit of ABC transporter with duplicated ATPase domains